MARSKVGPGLLLALLMLPIGLVGGGIYAVLTPQDLGLATGAVVLAEILLGGLLAVVAGIVLAVALPYHRLRQVVLGAGVVSALAVLFIAFRFLTVREIRLDRAAQEAAAEEEQRAARRAEGLARGMPPAESLEDPPAPPAGLDASGPPTAEAWRHSVHLALGLPAATPAPDVAFYYPAPNGPMALTRDAEYYYALMTPGKQTGPCGEGDIPALFGEEAPLDLGTLGAERIEQAVREHCPTTLTAHGSGYVRTTTFRSLSVARDVQTERLCGDEDLLYVMWASVEALPGGPLLLTTLPHADGPNDFTPADSLRMRAWPAALHQGRFRLPEGSRVSGYTAYRYPTEGPPAWLVQVAGTTPGGDEHPPIDVAYQAWYFVRGDVITPLVDNDPGSRCGPQEIDLVGTLDLNGDGDRDVVFGPSLLVLERDGDGFRTRAAPRMPCVC